jgi:hypothetical protein
MPGMLFIGCFLPAAFLCFLLVWIYVGQRFEIWEIWPYWLYLLGSVPAFVLFLFILGITAKCLKSLPNKVYKDSFGFGPTPDVRIVNSSWDGSCDSDCRYLKFYADQSTIDMITSQELTRRRDLWRDTWLDFRPDDPSWWRPCFEPNYHVYTYDDDFGRHKRGHSLEQEVLIYYPSSKEAYYRYIGID